jgi:Mg/Co/Ni transporter MgtE
MSDKKIVRVRDCMNTEFDTIDGMETVRSALSRLRNPENKCAIVNKAHPDDEFGMLALADVGRQVLATDRSPDRVNVYEVMKKPVISVHPDMDVRYCARLFEQYRMSRAAVVENGQVIGVVAFTHLVMRGMIRDGAL